jgi:hypothetical protein
MIREYVFKIWCIFAQIENKDLTPKEQQEKIEEALAQFKNEVSAQTKKSLLREIIQSCEEKYLSTK